MRSFLTLSALSILLLPAASSAQSPVADALRSALGGMGEGSPYSAAEAHRAAPVDAIALEAPTVGPATSGNACRGRLCERVPQVHEEGMHYRAVEILMPFEEQSTWQSGNVEPDYVERLRMVDAVVRRHRAELMACFERDVQVVNRGLRAHPIEGTNALRLEIDASGRARPVGWSRNSLDACLERAAEGWLFPARAAGRVEYYLRFVVEAYRPAAPPPPSWARRASVPGSAALRRHIFASVR